MQQLREFVRRELFVELTAGDKESALRELAGLVRDHRLVPDADGFYARVIDRESQASTGIGLGIGIPHATVDGLDRIFIVVGRSEAGIEYDAPDGNPVHLVFLIGLTPDRAQYLKIIARISWLVRNDDLRQKLFAAQDLDALCELLQQH